MTRPRVFVSIEKGTITEIACDADIELVVFDVDRMKRAEFEAYALERLDAPADPARVDEAIADAEARIAKLFG